MDSKEVNVAKVAITIKKDTNKNILYTINKNKTIRDVIEGICRSQNLSSPVQYGLRLLKDCINSVYIDDNTLHSVCDADQLELAPSIDVMIHKIFSHKSVNFTYLADVKTDDIFINTIAKNNLQDKLLLAIEQDNLTENDLSTCLVTLLQLLKKQVLNEVSPNIVMQVIRIIKEAKCTETQDKKLYLLKSSFPVLCQILYTTGENYLQHKETIISEMEITHLMSFCICKYKIPVEAITLVNAMVKSVKEDKRIYFIKEMKTKANRKQIFNLIAGCNNNPDKFLIQEIYCYQSYILSMCNEALSVLCDIHEPELKKFIETEENGKFRMSEFIDFQESMPKKKWSSTDTLVEKPEDRFSIVTISTRDSLDTIKTLSNVSQLSTEDNIISALAIESLTHYATNHPINFKQTQAEEHAHHRNILITAEKITKMLAKILQISSRLKKHSPDYHPLVFNTELEGEIFPVLFSRLAWLLSKTRKEMRAYEYEDYTKVLHVLEKQTRMILDKKPVDLKQLLTYMKECNYKVVENQWEKERQVEWNYILENNPSLQDLKKEFNEANKKLVFEHRISILQQGFVFPKLPEKKNKQQYFQARLSENRKILSISDYDESLGRISNTTSLSINNIRHVIVGKNCPHYKDNTTKQDKLIFSLQCMGEIYYNFLTKDEKTTKYWIEGFNLLLGKDSPTNMYTTELKTLTDMDCALQLLEVQGIPLLCRPPPPIPPLPPKPPIPPKSTHLLQTQRSRSKKKHSK